MVDRQCPITDQLCQVVILHKGGVPASSDQFVNLEICNLPAKYVAKGGIGIVSGFIFLCELHKNKYQPLSLLSIEDWIVIDTEDQLRRM